jgi:hypothetical protein
MQNGVLQFRKVNQGRKIYININMVKLLGHAAAQVGRISVPVAR